MKRPIFPIFAMTLLLACIPSWAVVDLKSPPEGGIYDPGGFLNAKFTNNIKYRINYERTHRQFELFVILFEEEPSQGAEILAKQAGQSWSEGEYWAVIYQVGAEARPEALAGGAVMAQIDGFDPELVERNIRGARSTALMVTTPQSRLEEFVNNLTDGFGLVRIQAYELHEAAVKNFDEKRAASKKRKETIRVIAVIAVVVLLALAALAFFLWRTHFRKRKTMEFPRTSPRHRLAAPFSGGGDVLVSYGRKR